MTDWIIVAVLAALFVAVLTQFIRQWRAARRPPSACPAELECRGSDDVAPEPQPEPQPEAEPEAEEPQGILSRWGAQCSGDMYDAGTGQCGPNCTCVHCREGRKACGAGCGCRKCRAKTELFPAGAPSLAAGVTHCQSMADVDAALQGEGVMLMHMQGCPPCEAFKPVFTKVAPRAQIPFYAVDAVRVPDIAQRFNLVGFPTTMRFANGRIVAEYQGDRTERDLLLFASSTL